MTAKPPEEGFKGVSEAGPKPVQTNRSAPAVISAATGRADCPAFKPLSPPSYPIKQQSTDNDRMAAASNVVRLPVGDSADVALAAAGDRQAFERLYRMHADRVFSLCARMSGSRVRGEELTQDVFVRTWEKLPQFRGESAFSTWLHRLAVNVVLNARKIEGKQASRTEQGDVDDERWDEMARAPLHIERMDLTEAISKLPAGARKVFVLHDVEGFKHEEIAEMMGITSGGSKAQLHRARLLLREALER
jgi:RNA polymerase sigma-70 factor (ECF subfamily)